MPADGSGLIKQQRGKRPSVVAQQCQWALEQELANTPTTLEVFMLLGPGQMVKRIHGRLTQRGMTAPELPKPREIARWKKRLAKAQEK
jgi:hypothetical protein